MALNEQDVMRLAQLAKIALPAERCHHAQQALNHRLPIIEQLTALDLHDTEPLTHPLSLYETVALPLREDTVTELASDLQRSALMHNAPQTWEGFFLVPKVLD